MSTLWIVEAFFEGFWRGIIASAFLSITNAPILFWYVGLIVVGIGTAEYIIERRGFS
jgi:hypothetical protein